MWFIGLAAENLRGGLPDARSLKVPLRKLRYR
jgi:hypothetical protein